MELAAKPPAELTGLPPDLLKQILQYLGPKDLAGLACTSRALAGLASAEDLWQGHASRWKHWAPGRYDGQSWRQKFIARWTVRRLKAHVLVTMFTLVHLGRITSAPCPGVMWCNC